MLSLSQKHNLSTTPKVSALQCTHIKTISNLFTSSLIDFEKKNKKHKPYHIKCGQTLTHCKSLHRSSTAKGTMMINYCGLTNTLPKHTFSLIYSLNFWNNGSRSTDTITMKTMSLNVKSTKSRKDLLEAKAQHPIHDSLT